MVRISEINTLTGSNRGDKGEGEGRRQVQDPFRNTSPESYFKQTCKDHTHSAKGLKTRDQRTPERFIKDSKAEHKLCEQNNLHKSINFLDKTCLVYKTQ